ncbi:MAG: TonB-dependent receptor [Lentimicrobiaceae bacterium]|nr:TonB-dependent receptor [Lentimicrobiaceae bacterium]
MKVFYLFLITFLFTNIGFSQNDTIKKIFELPEIKIYSAGKFENNIKDVSCKIDVIDLKKDELILPQTAGELLAQSGAVFLQTSQLGGGSPVIRGFEANRVLLVIDGVRLNNTIYRSGHLQNVITIDPNALERAEVLQGPGSVVYGSDALGGVMAFYTKNPEFANENRKFLVSGTASLDFQTASLSPAGNFTLNLAGRKFASLTSYSYKMVNDLRVGRNMNLNYGDWGLCNYYAQRIDDKDSTVKNHKPWAMKNSGYQQWDVLQKFVYQPTSNISLVANLQVSTSTNVPRYDRLLNMKGKDMEYAEFYYGPQDRFFGYLTLSVKNQKHFDDMRITLGGQYIEESRVQRKFRSNDKRFQNEAVAIGSLNADWQKKLGKTKNFELCWGIEGTFNKVNSQAYNLNIVTDEKRYNAVSRYPDSLNHVYNLSTYLTHSWKINPKWIFSQGVRFSYQYLHSCYTDTMMRLTKFPFNKTMVNQTAAPTGFLGLVFMPKKSWRFALNLSSGFKSPNVDDMTKVNDSKADDRQLIIPNPQLKPEYVYNADLSIEKNIRNKFRLGITGFFSINQNVVDIAKTQLNGEDSVIFSGRMCDVYSLQNIGLGYITGIQGFIDLQITKFFNINGNVTYTYGRTIENTPQPLSHIPPVYGKLSFLFKHKGFTGDFYVRFNGWKYSNDINVLGEDNYTMGLPNGNGGYFGFPAWFTLNAKVSYKINNYITLHAGIENMLNTYYRLNASGISAPGINGIVGFRLGF